MDPPSSQSKQKKLLNKIRQRNQLKNVTEKFAKICKKSIKNAGNDQELYVFVGKMINKSDIVEQITTQAILSNWQSRKLEHSIPSLSCGFLNFSFFLKCCCLGCRMRVLLSWLFETFHCVFSEKKTKLNRINIRTHWSPVIATMLQLHLRTIGSTRNSSFLFLIKSNQIESNRIKSVTRGQKESKRTQIKYTKIKQKRQLTEIRQHRNTLVKIWRKSNHEGGSFVYHEELLLHRSESNSFTKA